MQQISLMICILLSLISMPAFAAGPALNLGQAAMSGATVSFPVTLTNVPGTIISGVSTDIGFNTDVFVLTMDSEGVKPVSAAIGPAATGAGKQIFQSSPSPGVLRILVFDLAGNAPIVDGVVVQVSFTIKSGAAPGNDLFTNYPSATDPNGNNVSIGGSNTAVTIVSPTVTPSAGGNGGINPNTPQTVSYNGTASFTVTPAGGYQIESVTGCGGSLSGTAYTTDAVTANCSVTASFSLILPAGLSHSSGDLNGDGTVDVADALRALQMSVGLVKPTVLELALCDVAPLVSGIPAPDGKVDISDAYLILKKTVGLVSW